MRFRLTRPVPHEDGHVIEIARVDWEIVDRPVVQVHMTTAFPGRIRAWGLHARSTDRLFVATGLVDVVCYDGRLDSPTYGCLNQFTFSGAAQRRHGSAGAERLAVDAFKSTCVGGCMEEGIDVERAAHA